MGNKKINYKLQQKNGNLTDYIIHLQKFAIAGQIFSDITHEFNNIVGAMLGFTQIAKMTNDEKDIKKCFEVIISCSEKAKEMNSNILFYLQSNPKDENLVDVNSIIQQSITLVKKGFDKKGIEIRFKSERIPLIKLRVGFFQHAFLNLLLDAKRSIPPGGELNVAASFSEREKNVEIFLKSISWDKSYKNNFKDIESFYDIFQRVDGANGSNKVTEAGIAYLLLNKEIGGGVELVKNDETGTGYLIKIPT